MQGLVDGRGHGLAQAHLGGHRHRRQRRAGGAAARIRRRLPGHHAVGGGAERVEVGPGTMRPGHEEFFRRRVGRSAGAEHGTGLETDRRAQHAEAGQHGAVVSAQQDVLRADVPVQQADGVRLLQAGQHRRQQAAQLRLAQGVVALENGFQRLAGDALGHVVTGAIGLELPQHPDQAGMIELLQQHRLVEEAAQPEAQRRLVVGLPRPHRAAIADGELVRQEFLNQDFDARCIPGEIGMAVTALLDDFRDFIRVKTRPHRQRRRFLRSHCASLPRLHQAVSSALIQPPALQHTKCRRLCHGHTDAARGRRSYGASDRRIGTDIPPISGVSSRCSQVPPAAFSVNIHSVHRGSTAFAAKNGHDGGFDRMAA